MPKGISFLFSLPIILVNMVSHGDFNLMPLDILNYLILLGITGRHRNVSHWKVP